MSQNSGARTCRRVMRASQLVFALCAVVFAARTVFAFVIVDIGGLESDPILGTSSNAVAVKSSGQVVGWSGTFGNAVHAISWTQAEGMVDLGTLGGTFSEAVAVNTAGQVVGSSTTADGASRAFVWDPATGMMSDLGHLGGGFSQARR
jgi:probable HAF family extracellular repeat protein